MSIARIIKMMDFSPILQIRLILLQITTWLEHNAWQYVLLILFSIVRSHYTYIYK